MAEVSLLDIKAFFGYGSAKEFRDDWTLLTDEDRAQIRQGLNDGSLTY